MTESKQLKNKYSFSEFIKNVYSLILTKITLSQARLIRRPVYIRGRKSIEGATDLTTGRMCRFDLDGSNKTLRIGKKCEFGDYTHIVALNHVAIGDNVLIASKVFISDTNHGTYSGKTSSSPFTSPNDRKLIKGSVTIGNNVWIGENVVILSGAKIGNGCIVGANAVVNKSFGDNLIIAGVPARAIKKWDEKSGEWRKIK